MPNYHNQFHPLLTSFLSQDLLHQTARHTQAVIRQHKFCLVTFVWTLLLGFCGGHTRSLANLRRIYNQHAPKLLSASAFGERFTSAMADCLEQLYYQLAEQALAVTGSLSGLLAGFTDVLCCDSTLLTLHASLAKLFPGVAPPASAKVHLVLSARAKSPAQIHLCQGRRSDKRQLVVGPWVAGKLLLLDMGYAFLRLLDTIDRQGGSFVTRLSGNFNPRLVYDYRHGHALPGRLLSDYRVPGQDVDLEGVFSFKSRVYRGVKREVEVHFRIVGLWDEATQDWMSYLTNLGPELFTDREVGVLYRGRWEVELLFEELKRGYALDELNVRRSSGVRILVWSALMTLLVSRRLLSQLARLLRCQKLCQKRWWRIFCSTALEVLALVLGAGGAGQAEHLLRLWLVELPDPNRRKRLSLLDQVERGIYYDG